MCPGGESEWRGQRCYILGCWSDLVAPPQQRVLTFHFLLLLRSQECVRNSPTSFRLKRSQPQQFPGSCDLHMESHYPFWRRVRLNGELMVTVLLIHQNNQLISSSTAVTLGEQPRTEAVPLRNRPLNCPECPTTRTGYNRPLIVPTH